MPYINKDKRKELDLKIQNLNDALENLGPCKGNLNYAITKLVVDFVEKNGLCYDTLSDITGILNDVKTEFERQVVAPYEDRKIIENGDIYNVLIKKKRQQ